MEVQSDLWSVWWDKKQFSKEILFYSKGNCSLAKAEVSPEAEQKQDMEAEWKWNAEAECETAGNVKFSLLCSDKLYKVYLQEIHREKNEDPFALCKCQLIYTESQI